MLSVYEIKWYNISVFMNTIYMKTLLNRSFIKQIKSFILIAFASVFYGMGIALFLDPNNLASGGLSGISIIINRVTGIETGTMIFLLNIPIMIIGWWKFGGKFMLSTIFAIIMTSGFINYFSLFEKATDDLFLAAVTGGALVAVSIGIIFRAGATTGGTDIIVRLIKLKYKHMKTGGVFLILDMLQERFSFCDAGPIGYHYTVIEKTPDSFCLEVTPFTLSLHKGERKVEEMQPIPLQMDRQAWRPFSELHDYPGWWKKWKVKK